MEKSWQNTLCYDASCSIDPSVCYMKGNKKHKKYSNCAQESRRPPTFHFNKGLKLFHFPFIYLSDCIRTFTLAAKRIKQVNDQPLTFSPAARITSWPSSAGFLLPDTGASRKYPPFAVIAWNHYGILVMMIHLQQTFLTLSILSYDSKYFLHKMPYAVWKYKDNKDRVLICSLTIIRQIWT